MFYERYVKLCNAINKSPSAVAEEIGLKKSTVNRWKNGGMPSDKTLYKLADYFNVTFDYLKNGEESAEQAELSKYPKEVLDLANDIYDLDEATLNAIRALVKAAKKKA